MSESEVAAPGRAGSMMPSSRARWASSAVLTRLPLWPSATPVPAAVVAIRRGHVARHRAAMVSIYVGACLVAGAFTLLPGRFLGDLIWKQGLGLAA